MDYLLPHREAAWVLMEERLREAAAFAVRCDGRLHAAVMVPLSKTAKALERFADSLAAAAEAG